MPVTVSAAEAWSTSVANINPETALGGWPKLTAEVMLRLGGVGGMVHHR